MFRCSLQVFVLLLGEIHKSNTNSHLFGYPTSPVFLPSAHPPFHHFANLKSRIAIFPLTFYALFFSRTVTVTRP